LRKHLEQHHEQKFKELLDIEEHEKSCKRSREDKGQPRIDETLDALTPITLQVSRTSPLQEQLLV